METQEQSSRLVYGLPGKELYTVKCVLVGLSASPFSLLEAALGNEAAYDESVTDDDG